LQRFVIHDVPWEEYSALLRLWDGRHIRATYDRGTLELMTTACEHEFFKSLWGYLVRTLSLELGIDMASRGQMTFKRELKERGLEPDECYWIEHELLMRSKTEYDIDKDPVPDLVLEIEVSVSALDKMDIYANLGFPEVWRFDGETIHVHQLQADGRYAIVESSRSFPDLPITDLARWLLKGREMSENALIRAFSVWVCAGMPVG